jgi:anti-sigma B factor antagonist
VGLLVQIEAGPAGEVVVVLRGELEQTTVAQFRQVVAEALVTGPARLVLELGSVTFMDSSGLSALVGVRHACDRVGCRVSLSGVSPALRRTLHTTGLTEYLNADETP